MTEPDDLNEAFDEYFEDDGAPRSTPTASDVESRDRRTELRIPLE